MAIKFGITTWAWVSPFKTADIKLFPKIKRMGFDLVEVAVEDPSLLDADKIAAALQDNDLGATMCGVWGPNRDLSSEDPSLVRASLDYIHTCLGMCEQMDIKVLIGPMYSSVGNAHLLSPAESARERARSVSHLKKAAAMAADHDVVLGIEPLNRFEISMVNTVEQALGIIRAVGSRNLQVHLDTFHMNIEEKNTEAAIKACKNNVCNVHANESDRGIPGTGQVHWDGVARGLKAIKYDGPIVMETFTPAIKAIAKAVAIWRPLAKSQDVLARDGLKFLRKTIR